MRKIKILIVEDERKIAETLSKGLGEQQFEVEIAFDGLSGKEMVTANSYDLAIIDINLPVLNGYELCKYIRSYRQDMLVFMLTAMGSMDDKLTGFSAGADDYLIKPFDFKELLARIRALLKRSNLQMSADATLQVADLVLNLNSREVVRNGNAISLTAKEFQLLEYFVRNKNRVLSRADIAIDVWDIDFDTKTNVIDVYVNFLRKKIDRDFSPKLIQTYVGVGYVLKEVY